MGCACGKPSAIEDSRESPRERPPAPHSVSGTVQAVAPAKLSSSVERAASAAVTVSSLSREEVVSVRGDGGAVLVAEKKHMSGPIRANGQDAERRRERQVYSNHPMRVASGVPKAMEGEQVAAGWPPWLAAVAGEAIRGWVPRRADSFEKLDKIGQGTYSNVYRARDLDNDKIVALKKVRFDNLEPESVKFMAREILILRRLDHPNIIKLEGLVTSRMSCSLYLVFEYMEHDLAGLASFPGLKFTEPQVEQLHKIFKLCGSPSDEYWRKSKLPHATIFKPQQPYRRCVAETFKDFPASALALMDVLLSIDPADRGTSDSALKSEFFTTKPLSCDPSSLPKYPPSKEFDAKRRDEEARRQGAAGGKVHRLDLEKRGLRESRVIPAPDANAELASSLQKRQGQLNTKSRSEKFNPHQEEVASGFPIEPPRPTHVLEATEDSQSRYPNRSSHSGPLVHRSQWSKARKNEDDIPKATAVANLSALSGFVAARRNSEKIGAHLEEVAPTGRLSESSNEPSDATRKYAQIYHRKEDERNSNMDQYTQQSYGPKGNKIHYSGPLPRPSGNIDQMLKDHDRQIQEVFRRARLDKSKVRKVQGNGNQIGAKPSDFGAIPVYPSSRGPPFPVFTSNRGAVQ
ncbi:probable serine/threonine-protein kinase At1g09600 isoform X3 [Phoenix dactylifera]|uniref:[RNA-polymerase]-subunit kinase n=1 Tax=Phoenix dactylifera TaxID=42345 RepID=A0A8B9AQI9_PHODC|nr:probable serine/threonine-protein kinase At1g09600 isoform X3 [Phoenix dactylifera]